MIPNLSAIILVHILTGSLLNISTRAEPLFGKEVTNAKKSTYPYVISLAHKNDGCDQERLHFCTGVLISNRFALTAAHCLNGKSPNATQLVLGSVDLRKGEKYDPSTWITYNQWAESKNITMEDSINDIAVIKLSDNATVRVKPAGISTVENYQLYNEYVILVGWGLTNESPNRPTRYLQQVKIKVLHHDVCLNIMYDLFKKPVSLPDRYLCTKGEPYALTAAGDSGGPVLWKDSVVGITKGPCPNVFPCGLSEEAIKNHKINTHTGTHFYAEFINDVLNNYENSCSISFE